jgi:hypothetical protein
VSQKLVLMYVGEAAALGLAIKVPILVRSLADSMSITTSGPSLQFHESMLAALDNGLPAEDPCALVPDYACDWWNNDAEPDAGQIMSSTNLAKLLAIHETHRPISDLQVQSPASSGPEPACSHCHEYRDLAAEAVGELESMLQYADAMHVSAEGNFEADMRRAQGCFLLHEGVQQKEMCEKATEPASPLKTHKGPAKIDGVNVNRKSQRAHATARAELERLQQLPPASHKWTWGAQLTEAEAVALLKPAGKPVLPHTGYDVSLPSGGWMRFPESRMPSMPNLRSSNRVSPASSQDEIPLLPKSNVAINRLAFRTRLSEVQGSEKSSGIWVPDAKLAATWGAAVPVMEQQPAGVNREALAGDAEMQDAEMQDANDQTDDLVRDLGAVWGKLDDADNETSDEADVDSDALVRDLGAVWGKLDDAADETSDEAADNISDEAADEISDEADVDSDALVRDLAPVWGKLFNDAENETTE